tara:strand:- start:40 stop:267 length:228 start_codon:yes stop_codon:yes gene_type:complete
VSLILKDKKGNVIDKTGYNVESGDIFYKENKVGTFEQAHDSNLGTYYLYIMNNGEEYHDHYADEKEIIKEMHYHK